MKTLFLTILFNYIGLPIDSAAQLALIFYILFIILLIGALICTVNTSTYTKRTAEQVMQLNDALIYQNNRLLKEISSLKNEVINISQNEIRFMQYIVRTNNERMNYYEEVRNDGTRGSFGTEGAGSENK